MTADSIAGRALRGGLVLGVRQVLVHGANLLGLVVLARLLSPAEFGAVTIALFLQNVLASVGALGLGTSLVRQSTEPTLLEQRTVLATQQLAAGTLALGCWIAAPWLVRLYALPANDLALFRAVALSLVLLPLQTVPVVLLERRLRFARLAVIEVAQALAYNATAMLLVWRGAGTTAVAAALLLRALLAALLANLASPWRIGWACDLPRLRALARFGVPLQAASWISLLKDGLTPILLGLTAGAAAVGFVDWAQKVATYPTLALMILQRVYVPAFARVQNRPVELRAPRRARHPGDQRGRGTARRADPGADRPDHRPGVRRALASGTRAVLLALVRESLRSDGHAAGRPADRRWGARAWCWRWRWSGCSAPG